MSDTYSLADLLDFLDHAGDRGLMPAATAAALAVATRNIFGILTETECADLAGQDVDTVIGRFNNMRADDFHPSSLKEYGRRAKRAVDLFQKWRADPANFSVKTRVTAASNRPGSTAASRSSNPPAQVAEAFRPAPSVGTYQSSVAIRPGLVVTIANVPIDLSRVEAERLAAFVRMLAVTDSD